MGRRPIQAATRGVAAATLALAGGCATTVVVPKAPTCPAPALLTLPCEPLKAIPEGTSYGELLKIYQEERRNLALCAQRQRDLAQHVAQCNAELGRYNDHIDSTRAGAKSGS